LAGEEVINGKTYRKYVSKVQGVSMDEQAPTDYMRTTPQGLYSIEGDNKDKPEYLDYPFPLKVGTTWTRVTPEGEEKCRVEGVETVELPTQKYEDCLKIVSKLEGAEPRETVEYLAKGVGTVKWVGNGPAYKGEVLLVRYTK
jgi:hypothetical protein